MNEQLFRKKSIDKVKSPESLNDYLHVSNPSVWLLLISVIVLLAGACVWVIFGHIDSTVETTIHAENGNVICYIEKEDITSVQKGMTVKFGGVEAVITEVEQTEDMGYSCVLKSDRTIPEGVYEGKVVTKSIKPLSFILN